MPENFQRSEYVQECGFVDLIVQRKDLQEKIFTKREFYFNKVPQRPILHETEDIQKLIGKVNKENKEYINKEQQGRLGEYIETSDFFKQQ